MRKTGTVVNVNADDTIEVLFERPEACAKCGACSEGKTQCTSLTLKAHAGLGDEVVVEIPEGRVAQASMLAYIVPLALFIAGLLVAGPIRTALNLSIQADLFTVLCGLLGIGAALLVLRALEPHMKKKGTWQPRIVSIRQKNA